MKGRRRADAERVPLADARFDLAISEYGACLWADPHHWVPEAARLLRPGGDLIFLTRAPSWRSVLCAHPRMLAPRRGEGRS